MNLCRNEVRGADGGRGERRQTLAALCLVLVFCGQVVFASERAWAQQSASQSPPQGGFSVPTAFEFRGALEQHGAPAHGVYDFRFELYDRSTGGAPLSVVAESDVIVRSGTFQRVLDFGRNVLAQESPFIQVHVRESRAAEAEGDYVVLEPRQRPLGTAAPCTVAEDLNINGQLTVDAEPGVVDVSIANSISVSNAPEFGNFTQVQVSGTSIEATSGVVAGVVRLNANGGNVGIGTEEAEAPLNLPAGPDASLGAGGALVVGEADDLNIAFDNNEIMARNNGAPATLLLNREGGDVLIGGTLDIGIERVTSLSGANDTIAEVSCSAGKQIVSGGCFANTGTIKSSLRTSATSWQCLMNVGDPLHQAIAICGRLRNP